MDVNIEKTHLSQNILKGYKINIYMKNITNNKRGC